MTSKRARVDLALTEVYNSLPTMACKGLCLDWCDGHIPMTARERARIRETGQRPPPVDQEGPCSALAADGGCSIYAVRPLICRLWGSVENMTCPHGCVPEGGMLSRTEGAQAVARVVAIAGEAT